MPQIPLKTAKTAVFLKSIVFFGNKILFWKETFVFFWIFFFWVFFFLGIFFFGIFFFFGTARHCPALPAAMFGRHCQPPFLVRHCYLRRFNMREGGRTVGTEIVTQGQCAVDLWTKKKQKNMLLTTLPPLSCFAAISFQYPAKHGNCSSDLKYA